MMNDLLKMVKDNLILNHSEDDALILSFIISAIDYAESYQHLPNKYYLENEMSPSTRQAVLMLASHFYESRDGSTGGFFADKTSAAANVWSTVNRLLVMNKEWQV